MRFKKFDLNLLVVFEALVAEANVSRAARRLQQFDLELRLVGRHVALDNIAWRHLQPHTHDIGLYRQHRLRISQIPQ